MLEYVLKRVAGGGIHSVSELARELDTTETLVEQMLEDLERMGYLRRVALGCGGHCDGCEAASACGVHGVHGLGQVWAVTGPGRRAGHRMEFDV
jgi:hypothetical protein